MTHTQHKDTKSSIYVPSLGLYVDKERVLYGKDWHIQQQEIINLTSKKKMLRLYSFVELLLHLHTNLRGNPEYEKIFDDITKKIDPYREERFDDFYFKKKGTLYVIFHEFGPKGNLVEKTQELEPCLMERRFIDLEEYLHNHTLQGLPREDISAGRLFYSPPKEDSVAGFWAGSGRAGLNCGWNPGSSSSGLGVRAQREV